jgi:hypothetical protein
MFDKMSGFVTTLSLMVYEQILLINFFKRKVRGYLYKWRTYVEITQSHWDLPAFDKFYDRAYRHELANSFNVAFGGNRTTSSEMRQLRLVYDSSFTCVVCSSGVRRNFRKRVRQQRISEISLHG